MTCRHCGWGHNSQATVTTWQACSFERIAVTLERIGEILEAKE